MLYDTAIEDKIEDITSTMIAIVCNDLLLLNLHVNVTSYFIVVRCVNDAVE